MYLYLHGGRPFKDKIMSLTKGHPGDTWRHQAHKRNTGWTNINIINIIDLQPTYKQNNLHLYIHYCKNQLFSL